MRLSRLLRLYPLLLVALVWEAAARGGLVRPLFLPPLSTVLAGMPGLLRDGDLAGPLLTSLGRAAAGLVIAMAAGLILGLAIARLRWARLLFGPLVAFGAPAPKIALLPVFIAWFGIGHFSKSLLVAATAVFPFILAAQAGAEGVPMRQIWAARAMGTSSLALFQRVVFPAALPSVLNGVRVAVPYALITAFTAEMIAGGGGAGRDVGHGATLFRDAHGIRGYPRDAGSGLRGRSRPSLARAPRPPWHEAASG